MHNVVEGIKTMSVISMPYGKEQVNFFLDDKYEYDQILPPRSPAAANEFDLVKKALESPLNDFKLKTFGKKDRIAIAVNDKTRPVPLNILIPPLINFLHELGASQEQIKFIIASGTHIPMQDNEFCLLFNKDIIENYRIYSHNCDEINKLVPLGVTKAETPIFINKEFYEADVKIVVGHIEPHHFMGYSGGVKTASIGLAGRETINKNHEMLLDPRCATCTYANNPMRMDVEEIGDIIAIDCALNCVLNTDKKIINVLFGRPRDVIENGIKIADSVCRVGITKKYDLVVASPGGYPKDINLYQSQKAITQAASIIKDNGYIILAAKCSEGSGSKSFEKFMEGMTTPYSVINKFKESGFSVGPHKAFQIAREAARINILIKSHLPRSLSKSFLLTPIDNIENTVNDIFSKHEGNIDIAIMPNAINTIPQLLTINLKTPSRTPSKHEPFN